MKVLGISLILIGLLLVGYFVWQGNKNKGEYHAITTFEECVAAGNPVMESYPEQCRDSHGNMFVRELSEEEQTQFREEHTEAVFSWEFTEQEDPETHGIISNVVLTAPNGDEHELGDVYGSCVENEEPEPPAISSVSCWWAGAGTNLRVVEAESGYRVELSSLDEGTFEVPGTITTYEELYTF